MSKISGLGAGLIVDGIDISNGTASLDTIASPKGLLPATGIDKSAQERLEGLLSGSMSTQVYFDPVGVHLAVKDLPSTDVVVSVALPRGIGNMTAEMLAKQVNYGLNRTEDGGLTGPVGFESTGGVGIAYGVQLSTYLEDFTGAADTPSLDLTGASTGGTLTVQCTEFTGTNVTIDLEESSDDGAGDAFAAVAGSTLTFTAVGGQRVDLPAATTVERYVLAAVAGTFTTCTLLISYSVGVLA